MKIIISKIRDKVMRVSPNFDSEYFEQEQVISENFLHCGNTRNYNMSDFSKYIRRRFANLHLLPQAYTIGNMKMERVMSSGLVTEFWKIQLDI